MSWKGILVHVDDSQQCKRPPRGNDNSGRAIQRAFDSHLRDPEIAGLVIVVTR
jgi:hypothetical protein